MLKGKIHKWIYKDIEWDVYCDYDSKTKTKRWCVGSPNIKHNAQDGLGCIGFTDDWPITKRAAIKRAKAIFDNLGRRKVHERVQYGY
jgi:hypothetical protein